MKFPPRFAGLAALLLAAAVAPGTSHSADNNDPPTLKALVISSDAIVVGKIVRTTMVERENELADISYNHTPRFTAVIATIQVDETIKGDPAAYVKFTYPKRARVTGEPVYDAGSEGVFMLRKSEKRDEYVADETGRLQPRARKEQIRAILGASRTSAKKGGDDDEKTP